MNDKKRMIEKVETVDMNESQSAFRDGLVRFAGENDIKFIIAGTGEETYVIQTCPCENCRQRFSEAMVHTLMELGKGRIVSVDEFGNIGDAFAGDNGIVH